MDHAFSAPTSEPVARRTRQAELRREQGVPTQDTELQRSVGELEAGGHDASVAEPVARRTRLAELRREHGESAQHAEHSRPGTSNGTIRAGGRSTLTSTLPNPARRTRQTELQRQRRSSVRNKVRSEDEGEHHHANQLATAAARRTRRAEQQRQRREAVRTTVQPPHNLGITMGNENAESSARQREVRAEYQRRRRAATFEDEPSPERKRRVTAESAHRKERRCASDSATQEARRIRRLANDQERAACRRSEAAFTIESLSSRVLQVTALSADEIAWMGKGQQYTQDPNLALAYYYCCAADPRSFVLGDECVHGSSGETTRQRLHDLLDDYPKANDVAACQKAAAASSSAQTDVWACASCGRILLNRGDDLVRFRTLDSLKGEVLLTDEERNQLLEGVCESFVRKYRQVFFDDDDVYYLIPDLVRDRDNIPMCEKCNDGPRASKFSVAAGHDYGRITDLPALSDVGVACITPTRCFGLELSLSGSSGHAIAFPSNGPCEMARVLPSVALAPSSLE